MEAEITLERDVILMDWAATEPFPSPTREPTHGVLRFIRGLGESIPRRWEVGSHIRLPHWLNPFSLMHWTIRGTGKITFIDKVSGEVGFDAVGMVTMWQ